MVAILTKSGGTGSLVAMGLEKLNIGAECFDESADDVDVSKYEAVFFAGDFAVCSAVCTELVKRLCAECAAAEVPTIFDPTPDALPPESRDRINLLAGLCEIFVPSDEDARALCGSGDPEKTAEHYLERGTRKVVVTLDKNGAYFRSAKESGFAPTFRADKVVDTAGAGNAFSAGLISGVIDDIPLGEAVVRANACGCIAIQKQGEYFPDASELRDYMLSHRFVVEDCKEF